MTTILHKRGTGIPSADDLSVGEIALDTSTGTAYTKLSNGTVVEIGGSGGDGYDDTQIREDLAQEVQDRKDGDQLLQDQLDAIPDSAGMVIQPDEPTDPVTGLQWMDSTTGRIWIWDEDKWLEFPK